MKKKDFLDLGLEEALADKAAAASAEELKGYVPLARFNEVNEAKKHAEESVAERDKQIESLKSAAGSADALKLQIAELQAANKQKDAEHAAEVERLRLDAAVDSALTAANARNLKAARALLDLSNAKTDEKGGVPGLKEQIDRLKAAEDTRFLFETKTLKGAKTGESGVDAGDGKPDLSAMTYEELARYFTEHPEAAAE